MRRIASALLTVLVVFVVTAGVASATDKSKFDSLIGKYAADLANISTEKFSPKAACVCQGGAFPNYPGVLARTGEPGSASIYCMVVAFAADGSLQGSGFCENFAVLGK